MVYYPIKTSSGRASKPRRSSSLGVRAAKPEPSLAWPGALGTCSRQCMLVVILLFAFNLESLVGERRSQRLMGTGEPRGAIPWRARQEEALQCKLPTAKQTGHMLHPKALRLASARELWRKSQQRPPTRAFPKGCPPLQEAVGSGRSENFLWMGDDGLGLPSRGARAAPPSWGDGFCSSEVIQVDTGQYGIDRVYCRLSVGGWGVGRCPKVCAGFSHGTL